MVVIIIRNAMAYFISMCFTSPNGHKSSGIVDLIYNLRGKKKILPPLGSSHMVSEPRLKHSGLFGLKNDPTYFVLVTDDQVLLEITGINKLTLIYNTSTLRCSNCK